ncbi:hypothetical protein H8959_004144 [Pygathrix nigripes]
MERISESIVNQELRIKAKNRKRNELEIRTVPSTESINGIGLLKMPSMVARGKQEADAPPTPARPGPQRWVRRSPGLLRGRVWSRDARCSQVRRRQWQPRRPASHVATGAALSRPGAAGRGARPHLARERAERRDWDPGARAEGGSGQAESSAPRYGLTRHSGSRDGRSLGRRLALVSRRGPLEGSLRREPPRVGAGGRSSAIYKFPELPALFHPLAAPEAGRRGGRGSGSLLVAVAGLGWCRAARPQVQTPPPRPPGRVRGDPASGPKGARAPRRCVSAPGALEGAADVLLSTKLFVDFDLE